MYRNSLVFSMRELFLLSCLGQLFQPPDRAVSSPVSSHRPNVARGASSDISVWLREPRSTCDSLSPELGVISFPTRTLTRILFTTGPSHFLHSVQQQHLLHLFMSGVSSRSYRAHPPAAHRCVPPVNKKFFRPSQPLYSPPSWSTGRRS